MNKLDLGLYSHPIEFWGNEEEPKRKSLVCQKLRGVGESIPGRCITQDSETNKLPTELFWPLRE